MRLRHWLQLARAVGAPRFFIDGSFVTSKADPGDLDAVILLPENFEEQVESGVESAIDLEGMLLTRRPEELFAAEDEVDWKDWLAFFTRTREMDGRTKGVVEVEL